MQKHAFLPADFSETGGIQQLPGNWTFTGEGDFGGDVEFVLRCLKLHIVATSMCFGTDKNVN